MIIVAMVSLLVFFNSVLSIVGSSLLARQIRSLLETRCDSVSIYFGVVGLRQTHIDIFVNYLRIFQIFSLAHSAEKNSTVARA